MNLILFLVASSIANLGLSVFFLLFNLHLLALGFNEAFLGSVSALMLAGSVCGALPAGWFLARCGLKPALLVTFGGGALVCVLLASTPNRQLLLALAFLNGLIQALRAVTIAPVVAQLTTDQNRSRGFSWFFALGISMGVLGGLLAGSRYTTLRLAAAFSALSLLPTLRLQLSAPTTKPDTVYPRSPFVFRYLVAAAVWGLVLGAFPSLYNAYFARRLSASTSQIGLLYSLSQLSQAAAILLAPRLFARSGLERGIVLTQLASALFLVVLAPRWPLVLAGACYALYMSFQYMNEPAWHTVLMNGVRPEERSGASSLNFLVLFSAQAAGAALFGHTVARLGYPAPLVAAALVALLAAVAAERIPRPCQQLKWESVPKDL
jgi:MFS family permease